MKIQGNLKKRSLIHIVLAFGILMPMTCHAGPAWLDWLKNLFTRPHVQQPKKDTPPGKDPAKEEKKPVARLGELKVFSKHSNLAGACLSGVELDREALAQDMVPRGSAVATSAGALSAQGITMILHAATGAMTRSGGLFEPTLESVALSVENSLKLARDARHKRVAIPFIGGSIFISRIGASAAELADRIVEAALKERDGLELRFVIYSPDEVGYFTEALRRRGVDSMSEEIAVVQGSITNFSAHGASAIINAANMEVQFGGGISGAIARASASEENINQEALDVIREVRETLNAR
jgi:O-acetyl-ADP-ribose deacetylase (regulator of RNase III)